MIQIQYSSFLFVAVIVWVLFRVSTYLKAKSINTKEELLINLLFFYFLILMKITFFPLRFTFDRLFPLEINTQVLVRTLDLMVVPRVFIRNMFGNIAIFIPLGIIISMLRGRKHNLLKVILVGFSISFTIEFLQLFIDYRITDVDDLIFNTIGYVIGYFIYIIYRFIFSREHSGNNNSKQILLTIGKPLFCAIGIILVVIFLICLKNYNSLDVISIITKINYSENLSIIF